MSPPPRIGPYVVERELGRGGGGVVYLARDEDLGRHVAIKTLPPEMARDAGRLAQLEREAKVLATLSHPNVASIHGLLKDGDERFLVLEYVPGSTLDELLARAPLPIDQALECARQIADGLEAAHDKGIVHRDLKPANVRRTEDGTVKVLDFGLAKELQEDLAGANASGHTSAIVGTPAYLSPEQIHGRPADRGADVWAFGCLLYEMLAGRPVFRGQSVGDLLHAVLELAPDLDALPPRTPPRVVELIRRCLHRDRRQRLRDLGDARIELEHALAERSSSRTIEPVREVRRGSSKLVAGALAFGVVIGGFGFGAMWPDAEPARELRLSFPLGQVSSTKAMNDDFDVFDLAPDGRSVAVRQHRDGGGVVCLRRLDSFELEVIPGTEGVRRFCFSPDGRQLAMTVPIASGSNELQLVKVRLDGSVPPAVLSRWTEGEIAWLSTGQIVGLAGPPSVLRLVSERGGDWREVPVRWPDDAFLGSYRPRPLPDGRLLVHVESFIERGYELSVAIVDPVSGEGRLLVRDAGNADWAESGHLLFTRHDQLFAVPFDLASGVPTGDPVGLFDGMRTLASWSHAPFRLAPNGTLVFLDGGRQGANRRIALITPDGTVSDWSSDRMAFEERLSIDERADRLTVTRVAPAGFYQIWGSTLSAPSLQLLHGEPGCDVHQGMVSPDGVWLYYSRSGIARGAGIHRRRLDGTGEPERLVDGDREAHEWRPIRLTSDGRLLLLGSSTKERFQLDVLDLESAERRRVQVAPPRFNAPHGGIDDSGRWICYVSGENGVTAPYVRRFDRESFTVGPELRVPLPPGEVPHNVWWRHAPGSGDMELIGWSRVSRRVVAVPCKEVGGRLEFGAMRELMDLREVPMLDWDMLSDGRVLATQPGPEELAPVQVRVVSDLRPALQALGR